MRDRGKALRQQRQRSPADYEAQTFPLDEFQLAIDTFLERRDGVLKVILEP